MRCRKIIMDKRFWPGLCPAPMPVTISFKIERPCKRLSDRCKCNFSTCEGYSIERDRERQRETERDRERQSSFAFVKLGRILVGTRNRDECGTFGV